jgi:hypothetical protein
MSQTFTEEQKNKLGGFKNIALIVAAISVIVTVIGFFTNHHQFAGSYLFSFLFWTGLTVGCLPMIMIHHLTEGGWGYPIRRFLEIGASMIPLTILFFLPVVFNLEAIYLWAQPEAVAHDTLLQAKQLYLNASGFTVRAVIYFSAWAFFGWILCKESVAFSRTHDAKHRKKLLFFSGLGLLVYALTVTFSSIDWSMSLEPHWYSTLFGLFFMIGNTITAFAFVILLCRFFMNVSPLKEKLNSTRVHDLGKLLLALVMLWAYLALSQFIIIWNGNLAEEVPYYIRRFTNGWQGMSIALAAFHFFIPFAFLLSRSLKRNLVTLAPIAGLILFMRAVDLFWYVRPVFSKNLSLHWLDLSCFVALGSIWIFFYISQLAKEEVVLSYDPEDGQGVAA